MGRVVQRRHRSVRSGRGRSSPRLSRKEAGRGEPVDPVAESRRSIKGIGMDAAVIGVSSVLRIGSYRLTRLVQAPVS